MNQTETDASLLMRVRDSDDREAWDEFSSIYRPAIVRLAKQKGLQNADSEDLAQQVLLSVSKAIENWKPKTDHPRAANFRTWLNRVTTNAVYNAVTRRKPDRGSGQDSVLIRLNQHPSTEKSNELTIEIRREVFRFAAKQIQPDFQASTWESFWLTAVEGFSVEEVGRRLGVSSGSIYAARSRVMRQLKLKINELQILEDDYESGKN